MEQINTASSNENSEVNSQKLWTKNYIFIMISNSFLFFGDNLLLPVLPIYVKQNGANDFQVGIVAAVFFITSIVMRIFTSRASVRFGKRLLLMLSLLVFTLSMLGYYFFASLTAVLILRLAQGVGFGASTTLYSTMAANIVPNKRMGEGIGYFGLGVTVACALGPCLGAAVIVLPNYKIVFLIAVFLEFVGMTLSFFIKVDDSKACVGTSNGIKNILSDVVEPKALYQSFFFLLIGLVTGGFNTYVVLFSKERNIKNIFVYFLLISLAECFVRLFSGKLYDNKGLNPVVIPGAIAGIISCIVMANATNLGTVSIAAFLFGSATGMIYPVMEANAMQSVTPERRIVANATLYNMLDAGMALGPLLLGVISKFFNYSSAFAFSSSIFIVMLLIIALTSIRKKLHHECYPE